MTKRPRIYVSIIVVGACVTGICFLWPLIKNMLVERSVSVLVEDLCGYNHVSAQLTRKEISSTDAYCGILTEEFDLESLVGRSSGVDITEFEDRVEYAYKIVIHSPDKMKKLELEMYRVNDVQGVEEVVKEFSYEYAGSPYLATIYEMVFSVDKRQIVEMIERIVSMDDKFKSDVIYDSFFQ